MISLDQVVQSALNQLTVRQANGYAGSVIRGHQRWSGADLKGKAKRYGASYRQQRAYAIYAIRAAGGHIISTEHGYLMLAVPAGMDDSGRALMRTRKGLAIAGKRIYSHIST